MAKYNAGQDAPRESKTLSLDERKTIAQTLFGSIEWTAENPGKGWVECPRKAQHTGGGKKDTYVLLDDGAPVWKCSHAHCVDVTAENSHALRSAIGKASVGEPVATPPKPKPAAQPIAGGGIPLPEPTHPGAAGMLEMFRLCFAPDEYIALAQNALDENGEMKPTAGVARKRSVWEEAIAEGKGALYRMTQDKDGLYIRVNPMQKGGSKDSEVAIFRHVLVEFDKDPAGNTIPKEVQFGLLTRSGLPITTVTDSGNKSLHALVRVDAKDLTEYRERVEQVYSLFPDMGLDTACKNPARLSRVAGGHRTVGKDVRCQTLIATNLGPASWKEYETAQKAAMVGAAYTIDQLLAYNTADDPNNVIGQRWLCKGASVLFVSQSGVGKSSLMMQLSIAWALNHPWACFGITPKKPLKILLMQAENDVGDMAEQVQGVVTAMGLSKEDKAELNERMIIHRDATHTGHEFLDVLESLVRLYKPDLVWIDPLLNYIGDDISDQRVCSKFTSRLSQIGNETGVITAIVHHTPKPKANGPATASDLAYGGFGSSVLTAWAREVVMLTRCPSDDPTPVFELCFTKRRTRAGAVDELGRVSDKIYIGHAKRGEGISWAHEKKPRPPEDTTKRGRFKK